jgi:NhaB family Na+:H+ antiporter
MAHTTGQGMIQNFLGNSPHWYKICIIAFLVVNPILLFSVGPFVTGWILILEFIFTLAMALKCYPLPAGGLLAIQAVFLGMTSPETIYEETVLNFPVILLLMFMVAGIYFMKGLLRFTFTKILIRVRSKVALGFLFSFLGAFLSAFLDALTVTAVIIAVAYAFYDLYHRYVSGKGRDASHDCRLDEGVSEDCHRQNLLEFRAFLRNLMMHGAVGTAIGGVTTLVGEPQNLLIAHTMGWHFQEFFLVMLPVTAPVVVVGFTTCILLEKFKLFGYGHQIPAEVLEYLKEQDRIEDEGRSFRGKAALVIQAIAAVILVVALALHLAEVGLIGLMVIILLTAFNGVTEEHRIGHAFEEALPFTALLVVFFAIVAVIHDQHLFKPVIQYVLSLQGTMQQAAYYVANGLLSAISDNVFVATVYVSETKAHFVSLMQNLPGVENGKELLEKLTDPHYYRKDIYATLPADVVAKVKPIMTQFDKLSVCINTGTNIPSVATPNGQAAFLFLLTSVLAPVIRLSYVRMVLLALPYTVTMSITGFLAVWYLL